MKIFILLVISLFFVLPSLADGLQCSSADGKFIFVKWYHSGGAAPFPGMLVGKTEFKYQGNLMGFIREYNGEPKEEDWNLDIQFDPSTKVVLEEIGHSGVGSVTYSQKLTVKRPDDSPLFPHPQIYELSSYVICKNSWNRIAP